MNKNVSFKSRDVVIREDNTFIHWDYNLTIKCELGANSIMIEGNKLHERLKKTLMRNVPSYIDKSGNFMVASVSLIASNAINSRVFTQPISAHFESNYCNECFTDSSVYDVEPQNVERHIHQRLDVANSFMGISLPYDYFPKDEEEFIWRSYHSEQALIEYLWKQESLNQLLNAFDRLGLRDYNHIRGIVLDIHSKYYVCEFCEVSLLGMQSPQHPKGWLSLVQKKLTERRYSFNANDLLMLTRVSADIAFPRPPMSEIISQQGPLASRSINVFNNQIMLAKDLGQFKCSAVEPFDDCTVFRSGSVYSYESHSPVKSPSKKRSRDF